MKKEDWMEYFQLFGEREIGIINYYLNNEMYHLKRIVNPVLSNYTSGNFEYDDIYDNTILVLCESIIAYNNEKSKFETFFASNVKKSLMDWHRDTHCRLIRSPLMTDSKGKIVWVKDESNPKKMNPVHMKTVSFDAEYDEGNNLKDTIPAKEDEPCKLSPEMEEYLNGLSKLQLKILNYLSEGYSSDEIMEILHINKSIYKDNMLAIRNDRSTRKIRHLYRR